MLSGERVLALIFMIMTDDLPKIVLNWAVLTINTGFPTGTTKSTFVGLSRPYQLKGPTEATTLTQTGELFFSFLSNSVLFILFFTIYFSE